MKRLLTYFLVVVGLVFALTGCGSNPNNSDGEISNLPTDPGMEGYVVSIENGRILVVDPIPQDFSSTGGISEFFNAIFFSNVPDDIEVGERVQVWFDEVAESYPGQAKAEKISVVPSEKPSGAELTEAKAIQEALASKPLDDVQEFGITVITAVNYDQASDVWSIHIKKGETAVTIDVRDTDIQEQASVTDSIPEVPITDLENKFKDSIYQEVDESTREVVHYDSKKQLVDDMAAFMKRSLAQYYVDEYFKEEDGKLYLIAMGGPTLIDFTKEYRLEKVDEVKAQAVQINQTDMAGKYEFTVTYEFQDGHWIMLDREFNSIN